jgi:putative transposase
MPRKPRTDEPGLAYHVLNRRAGRSRLFFKPADYDAFEAVLAEASGRFPGLRLLSYCLMPNHWHLTLLLSRGGVLSRYMQWVTTTHSRRWHAHRNSAGTGPVYQGRFKSFPIQDDDHLLVACRYVERNPLRAALVRRPQDWPWSSASPRRDRPWLTPRRDWPVEARPDWTRWVNLPQTPPEEAALRHSIARGAPFGDARWAHNTAARLHIESSLRPIGRPRKHAETNPEQSMNGK